MAKPKTTTRKPATRKTSTKSPAKLVSQGSALGNVSGMNPVLENGGDFTLTNSKKVGKNLHLSFGLTKAPRKRGGNKAMLTLKKQF